MSKVEELTDEQLAKKIKYSKIKIYSVMFTVLLPMTALAFLVMGLNKLVEIMDTAVKWFARQVRRVGPIVLHEKGPFRFVKRLMSESDMYSAEQARRKRNIRNFVNGFEDHPDGD